MAELQRLAALCGFGVGLDEALWDRLVCGLNSTMEGLQKKLLGVPDLTLTKAMGMAISFETVEQEGKQLHATLIPNRESAVLTVRPTTTPGSERATMHVFVVAEQATNRKVAGVNHSLVVNVATSRQCVRQHVPHTGQIETGEQTW